MASVQPVVFRWGIISTGFIASMFAKDMLVDPKTRDVHDLIHKVTAVGSRGVGKAQQFIDTHLGGDKSIKAYGTYEEVYADKDVDGIYIGTPHTYHYENALAAIKAKKHILCEKPVTSNCAELKSLLAAAKENDVFFMEALWTRFQPLALEFKKISDGGELGAPIAMQADLSADFNIYNIPKTHRILDPRLGGGALLDLGPYPLVWAIMALYENSANNQSEPTVTGTMLKTPLTDVDCNTSFALNFTKSDISAQSVLSCSINANTLDPGVIIRYERGTIKIAAPIYCPKSFTVQYLDSKKKAVKEETRIFEYVGGGWHFQADEVVRCVRDGKRESELWGHNKSLLEMNIFDEVRRQGGYVFPPGVEKVV